jgi:RNA polymerase sigma-70 factor, ECF subfamily
MTSATRSSHEDMQRDQDVALLNEKGNLAVAELFSQYRPRLERMVGFRLDQRLYGRIDPSDVLQEAYIEVARRIDDYLASPDVSFFVWVRQITWQTLLTNHRRHLGKKRHAGQDVPLAHRCNTNATSVSLARQLVSQLTSPSQAVAREEGFGRLRDAIDGMDETDREILALRHFELLTNTEAAEVLQLKKTAASNRYIRALKRLKAIVTSMPEFREMGMLGGGTSA